MTMNSKPLCYTCDAVLHTHNVTVSLNAGGQTRDVIVEAEVCEKGHKFFDPATMRKLDAIRADMKQAAAQPV